MSTVNRITRRTFTRQLGRIGVGMGALALTGCGPRSGEHAKRRKLGRTDLVLSPLGFGAQHTRDSDLIRHALDQGVNLIETAFAYGFGKAGNSCQCIGKAIAGKRDSVCLAVAFHYKSPRAIVKAMEQAALKGVGLICMKTQSPDYSDGEHKIGGAPDHRKALDWVISRPYVTAAIPGMTERSQLALNVQTLASMV